MRDPFLYRYGNQGPRFAANWRGGSGGVMPETRAAESFELGSLSGNCFSGGSSISGSTLSGSSLSKDTLGALMLESHAPSSKHYPTLWRGTHMGDWPSQRAAGQEPLDPSGLGAAGEGVSKMVVLLGAVGIAYFIFRKK